MNSVKNYESQLEDVFFRHNQSAVGNILFYSILDANNNDFKKWSRGLLESQLDFR